MCGPVAATALAAFLGGCTAHDPGPTPTNTQFSALVDRAIADARVARSSDGQLAALEAIRSAGFVSYEDVSAAIENSARCMEEAGLTLERTQDSTLYSWTSPAYVWSAPLAGAGGLTHEQLLAIGDECITRNSLFVEKLYQVQPVAVEVQEAWQDRNLRPALLHCLLDNGVAADESMSYDDLVRLDLDTFDRTERVVTGTWAIGSPLGYYEDCAGAVYQQSGEGA